MAYIIADSVVELAKLMDNIFDLLEIQIFDHDADVSEAVLEIQEQIKPYLKMEREIRKQMENGSQQGLRLVSA